MKMIVMFTATFLYVPTMRSHRLSTIS